MGTKRRRRTLSGKAEVTAQKNEPSDDSANSSTAQDPQKQLTQKHDSAKTSERSDTKPSSDVIEDSTKQLEDTTEFQLPAIEIERPLDVLIERMKNRREAMGLSIADVARICHMSPRTVQTLENEPLDRLDAPFYVKNRLRVYASALKLSPDVITDFFYDAIHHRDATVTISQSRLRLRENLPYLIAGGVLLLVAITLIIIL